MSGLPQTEAASMSAILAADEVVTDLIFQDGNNLTVDDLAIYITKAETVSANRRALEYFWETIARNAAKFLPQEKGQPVEIWGKTDSVCVYVIKSIFDRIMYDGGFNPRTFLSWAARQRDTEGRELVLSDRDSRNTRKTRLGDNAVNCVCLSKLWGTGQFGEIDDDEPLPF